MLRPWISHTAYMIVTAWFTTLSLSMLSRKTNKGSYEYPGGVLVRNQFWWCHRSQRIWTRQWLLAGSICKWRCVNTGVGVLWATLGHTTASTMRCFLCSILFVCVFYFGEKVTRAELGYEGLGEEWDWYVWCETQGIKKKKKVTLVKTSFLQCILLCRNHELLYLVEIVDIFFKCKDNSIYECFINLYVTILWGFYSWTIHSSA